MKKSTDYITRARSAGSGQIPEGGFAALTPELGVRDFDVSLTFWCDRLGFRIAYDRPVARFAYLVRESAHIMLYQLNEMWNTGELQYPLGRGMNFQFMVEKLDPILAALGAVKWPMFEEPRDAWYRAGPVETGQREFVIQDPDGYLLRFAESLGRRSPV